MLAVSAEILRTQRLLELMMACAKHACLYCVPSFLGISGKSSPLNLPLTLAGGLVHKYTEKDFQQFSAFCMVIERRIHRQMVTHCALLSPGIKGCTCLCMG
jgi:hypothetical protein